MNGFCKFLVVLVAVSPLVLMHVSSVVGAGPKISEWRAAPNYNKHNLSAKAWDSGSLTANLNPYRATDDPTKPGGQQICIFCHTPHNANVENQSPLWNRKFSSETFSRYSSATLQIRVNSTISAPGMANYGTNWAPDGASKLCLSCHDGVSKLNELLRDGGGITMEAPDALLRGGDVITGRASFKPSTNKMKIGHHPISFVYTGTVQQAISSARLTDGFKLPTAIPQVKLDKNNKMQCTTCHNAHQNQSDDTKCYNTDESLVVDCSDGTSSGRKVAPFWVYGVNNNATNDHDDVCMSCHNMTQGQPGVKTPWP